MLDFIISIHISRVLDVLDVTYKPIIYIAKAELCLLEIIYTETLRDFERKTDSLFAVM